MNSRYIIILLLVISNLSYSDQIWPTQGTTGGSGSTTFQGLGDTPANYSGQAGKIPVVNPTEDALIFEDSAVGSFIGTTTSTYDGDNTDYITADALCDTDFSGSHICSTAEILNTIAKENLSLLSDWTGNFWIVSGGGKYAPAATPVDDCEGWTSNTSTSLGSFWITNSDTSGGRGGTGNCNNLLKFACCR